MHLIQSLENEFCFDLPIVSEYPATSINSYFYKMTLVLTSTYAGLVKRKDGANVCVLQFDHHQFVLTNNYKITTCTKCSFIIVRCDHGDEQLWLWDEAGWKI